MAARSRAWVCGRLLAGIAGSNPSGVVSVCCDCCVFSGRGLCDVLITRPKESYWVWCAWVWSWILHREETLPHWRLLYRAKKKLIVLIQNARNNCDVTVHWSFYYCMLLNAYLGLFAHLGIFLYIKVLKDIFLYVLDMQFTLHGLRNIEFTSSWMHFKKGSNILVCLWVMW